MKVSKKEDKKGLLGGISNSAKNIGDQITGNLGIGGLEDLAEKFFPSEDDPSSGILETVSETATKFFNVGEQAVLFLTDNIGFPSIRDTVNEMQKQFEVADKVCDATGGSSFEIPFIGIDPEICISPKQINWAINPQNWMKSTQIGMSCGIEKNFSEPLAYNMQLLDIVRKGDYENFAGWITGALAGESFPDILHPAQLLTAPASFSACCQGKIAKEMGDLTEQDLLEVSEKITSEFGETQLGKSLLSRTGL
jgi:hypothetical protein